LTTSKRLSPLLIKLLICGLLNIFTLLDGDLGSTRRLYNPNPFKNIENFTIHSLEKVIFAKKKRFITGYPARQNISFLLKDKNGHIISSIPSRAVKCYLLSQNSKIPADTETVFSKGRYFSSLQLPPVAKPGWYDLLIEIFAKNSRNFSRQIKKAFLYKKQKQNIIFLVDFSASMLRNDPARQRIQDILNLLSGRYKKYINKTAIISFSDQINVLYPFSFPRYSKLKQVLKKKVEQRETNIPLAFRTVYKLLQKYNLKLKTIIVFLTDGVSSFSYHDEHLLLNKMNIPVYTIGLCGKNKNDFNPSFLQKVADDTGGLTFAAGSADIHKVYNNIFKDSIEHIEELKIYPFFKTYSLNVLVIVKLFFSHKAEAGNIKCFVDNRPADTMRRISKENIKEVWLFPLAEGRHTLQVRVFFKGRCRLQRSYLLRVKDKKCYNLKGSFYFKNAGWNRVHSSMFTIKNITASDHIFQISFLPLKNEADEELSGYFTVYNNPFLVKKKEKVIKTLSFLTGKIKPGLYSGYFTVNLQGRIFLNNLAVSLSGAKKGSAPEFITKTPANEMSICYIILAGVIVLIPLLIFLLFLFRKKHRSHKFDNNYSSR